MKVNMKLGAKNQKRNERGFITFDFIFALMMALAFTTVLFALTVSLSAVEVAQYITFATSRAYVGAHETDKEQEQLAQKNTLNFSRILFSKVLLMAAGSNSAPLN